MIVPGSPCPLCNDEGVQHDMAGALLGPCACTEVIYECVVCLGRWESKTDAWSHPCPSPTGVRPWAETQIRASSSGSQDGGT